MDVGALEVAWLARYQSSTSPTRSIIILASFHRYDHPCLHSNHKLHTHTHRRRRRSHGAWWVASQAHPEDM